MENNNAEKNENEETKMEQSELVLNEFGVLKEKKEFDQLRDFVLKEIPAFVDILDNYREDCKKDFSDMIQKKARCLIEYLHYSATLMFAEEQEYKDYLTQLESEFIDWCDLFSIEPLKEKFLGDQEIQKFREIANEQIRYYEDLQVNCKYVELKKSDLARLKVLIQESELYIFKEKEAWANLILYIEKNFDKLEAQRNYLHSIDKVLLF